MEESEMLQSIPEYLLSPLQYRSNGQRACHTPSNGEIHHTASGRVQLSGVVHSEKARARQASEANDLSSVEATEALASPEHAPDIGKRNPVPSHSPGHLEEPQYGSVPGFSTALPEEPSLRSAPQHRSLDASESADTSLPPLSNVPPQLANMLAKQMDLNRSAKLLVKAIVHQQKEMEDRRVPQHISSVETKDPMAIDSSAVLEATSQRNAAAPAILDLKTACGFASIAPDLSETISSAKATKGSQSHDAFPSQEDKPSPTTASGEQDPGMELDAKRLEASNSQQNQRHAAEVSAQTIRDAHMAEAPDTSADVPNENDASGKAGRGRPEESLQDVQAM